MGFLQPPGSEQYQMPQSPSPCSPPQMPQQYSGKRMKNLWRAWSLARVNMTKWVVLLELVRVGMVQELTVALSQRKTKDTQGAKATSEG